MSEIEAKLGRRIAGEREVMGLSQAQLAERVGVATETISRLERGVAIPSLARIETIAVVLEIALHDLLRIGGDSQRDRLLQRFMAATGRTSMRNAELALQVVEAVLACLDRDRV